MKPALIIIDLQKAFYCDENKESMERAAHTINKTLDLFRERALPVIWVQHNNGKEAVPGNPLFSFIDSLQPHKDEPMIEKYYMNSFTNTAVAAILAKNNCDTLVVSGFSAAFCVQATCVGAADRDIKALVLSGGIAANKSSHIGFVEEINRTITYEELNFALLGQDFR